MKWVYDPKTGVWEQRPGGLGKYVLTNVPEYSTALGRKVSSKQDYVDGLKKINANVDMVMEQPY